MTLPELIAAARAGKYDVARWHCHPQECLQNSGDGIIRHQREVATLALSLCAHIGHAIYEGDLIDYCQRHDDSERLFGDWPASICGLPEVKAIKTKLEAMFWDGQPRPLPDLSPREADIFALCDKLESVQWAMKCGADLDAHGFPDDFVKLRRRAHALGPEAMEWLEGQLTRAAIPA